MIHFTQEQQVLFSLLRRALGTEDATSDLSGVDWNAVGQEAQKQAVFLLVASAASGLPLPDDTKRLWTTHAYICTASNLHTLYSISQMDRVMRGGNFSYVLLKGLSAASYYPDYLLRALGDVDFLIAPAQQTDVEQALEADGYQNWNKKHICHVVFTKPRQQLEMHFEISGIPYGVPGERVRAYMNDVLRETILFSTEDGTYPLPLPRYHGLILLLHMQHHMLAEGIGLRHLMDWCCFVEKTAHQSFWQESLLPILKDIGLLKYAQVMTRTGALYFRTVCPDWCADAEENLCDAVMTDILAGGNFGRKNAVRAASGMMISEHGKEGTKHGKLYNLYATMHTAVKTQYPAAKRFPVLYPIYESCFAVRWVYRVLSGQRIPLLRRIHYAEERKNVYDRLEVFKI